MKFGRLEFRLHAVERMFERGISVADVRQVIQEAKIIENYPEDLPFPSCLILGTIPERPLHVVVAMDNESDRAVVVTVYEPDSRQWEPRFERRKRP